MAVATCVLNGDLELPFTKKLRCSSPAPSIARRKRFLSEESESQPHLPTKKIRFEDHVFSQDGTATAASTQGYNNINHPTNRAEWVDLMIKEMMGARSMDDARFRAGRLFDDLKKSIAAGAHAAVGARRFEERIEAISKENTVLKRAVAIQHQRQKEYEDMNQEVKQLKELVGRYQEQVRSLEVNNYGLTMHLQQALYPKPPLVVSIQMYFSNPE